MESLSIGGLASGLDTNAIIDGLTNLEMAKVTRIESKQKDVEVKLDAFNDLKTRLADFSAKADTLDDTTSFNLFTSESSDEDRATVTGEEDAISGTYQLEIDSLATEWKVTSKAYSSVVANLGLTGSFEISKTKAAIEDNPIETTTEIQVDASDTLKDLVNKINSAEGVGARASIISLGQNDFRMVLSAIDEGTEGFYMKDTGAGNILDSGGLNILNYQQQIYSDFNFRNAVIGAADTATQFSDLFAGIGSQTAVDAGDEISINGTDANGNAVSGIFTVGAGGTLQDLLNEVKTVFESAGSTVDVSLNSSGEIIIKDLSGGVQEMSLNMQFTDMNASGSELRLSEAASTGRIQNLFNNVLEEGKKAFFRLDGLSVASESNDAGDTVRGTVFHLKKAELNEVVELKLERNNDAIKEKIQGFIESYNSLMKYFDEKSKVVIENQDNKDPTKKQEIGSKGPFAGDSIIMKIKNDLRSLVTSSIEQLSEKSLYTSFAAIGITSNSGDGQLSLDEKKFDKALTTDFEGVRRLFVTSGYSDNPNHKMGRFTNDTKTGVYRIDADNSQIDKLKGAAGIDMADGKRSGDVLKATEGDAKGLMLDAPVGSGFGNFTFIRGIAGQIKQYWEKSNDRFDGHLTQTKEAMDRQIESYKDRAKDMADKVEAFRQRLIRQFAGLENSISRLQNQSGAFQAQMGAL